jgi:hypothetical protein
MLSLLVLPLFVAPSQAQFGLPYGVSRFRWEGVVDGTSYVRITHNRVRVETASGLPVQRQRYDFSDPLPHAAMNLELVVLDGRGRVRLVEPPSRWNDFTAVVRIDDRSGGRDFYSFELRWADRTRDDDYRDPRARDSVVWSGRVDGEVIVRFQRNQVYVDNLNGQGVWGDRHRFSAPLPTVPFSVNLVNTSGRGEILLVEQPSRANGYTASVRIRDRQSGASNYSFVLTWERPRHRYLDDQLR